MNSQKGGVRALPDSPSAAPSDKLSPVLKRIHINPAGRFMPVTWTGRAIAPSEGAEEIAGEGCSARCSWGLGRSAASFELLTRSAGARRVQRRGLGFSRTAFFTGRELSAEVLYDEVHRNCREYNPHEGEPDALAERKHARLDEPQQCRRPKQDPEDSVPGTLYLFHGRRFIRSARFGSTSPVVTLRHLVLW